MTGSSQIWVWLRPEPAVLEHADAHADTHPGLGVRRTGTTHTYRKTVATMLDEGGRSARAIADQLGHSRVSMTKDVYLGWKAKNAGNLDALEGLNPDAHKVEPEGDAEGDDNAGAA